MPVIDLPNPALPLSQGDILSGIKLYVTRCVESSQGNDTARQSYDFCMVLSRPCAAHKKTIVVAAVEKYPGGTPGDLDTFGKVLEFLKRTRDGHGTPDLFYLAQLPGKQGRFCARFDAIFTIQIPEENAAREQYLRDRRIGVLSPDFQRDLHSRLFGAFASLGFDDNDWFSKEDLDWLVAKGIAELRELEAKEAGIVATNAGRVADNTQGANTNELEGVRKKIAKLKESLLPLQTVLDNRQSRL